MKAALRPGGQGGQLPKAEPAAFDDDDNDEIIAVVVAAVEVGRSNNRGGGGGGGSGGGGGGWGGNGSAKSVGNNMVENDWFVCEQLVQSGAADWSRVGN